ncbi:MAG: AbrB/MazE/SpoVT family DNA-binding domain-containing protein [Bacteroides sp.]|nr:AbrB/MazE/SpoVT family DNA-binding domain-containing protein [Eubacterium sp.]MCM1419418.1 AbrB/MazE/SpoVT family DNA-binding domain-containing protein [Roseburia sp.]MCM1462995.1 AbrB/MazE/SpoVT family DNA-binding domain-containing protein [Bacteroides sp.]
MFHKKITSKRGITIPKALAFETGIDRDTPVDVYDDGGKIVIQKHVPACRFCGDKLRAVGFKGIEICPDCAAELGKAVAK